MSETSQGEGWWIASDGKWYPPETHPDFTPLPPTPYANTSLPPPGASLSRSYAGFWRRFGALILDSLILGIPFGIINAVTFSVVPTKIVPCTVDGQFGLCERPTGGGWVVIVLVWGAMLAFQVFYWWGRLVGGSGQTPGRMAAGIKVVDIGTGQPIGMGRAIGRGFFSWISAMILMIGYLWMLWDKNNQTLHDKVVDAVVIRT